MGRKFFTVSYDDGLEQDKRLIKLMKKYGIKGTFNLNAGLFGQKAYIKYRGRYGWDSQSSKSGIFAKCVSHYRIPENEIRQVYEGFEIASHGLNHLKESKVSGEKLKEEICYDRNQLQKHTNVPVVGHVLPFGANSNEIMGLLKQDGFSYVRDVTMVTPKKGCNYSFPEDHFTIHPTCWHLDTNLRSIVKDFINLNTEEDKLLYIWGHAYELDYEKLSMWEQIELIFAMLRDAGDIEFCTNAEVLAQYSK